MAYTLTYKNPETLHYSNTEWDEYIIKDKINSFSTLNGDQIHVQFSTGIIKILTFDNTVDRDAAMDTLSASFKTITDTTTTVNVTYIGKALTGSLASDAVWQISKIDTTTNTVITHADGDDNLDNIWNNRASLTYS